ncbi:MAG TPA: DUF433 domain-containing protein [Planctomycetota bacterium]|nr:DUF433 domain-containing protein [Planctomycetota bacterium]
MITVHSAACEGKPCIRGLPITVFDVLDQLAAGLSTDEILTDFPELTPGDLRAACAFAAELGRRNWPPPGG